MVLKTGQPNQQDTAECGVANITSGRQCSWFRKLKNDSAKAKWLSDSNWRFFTVDFDDRQIFYSSSEGVPNSKTLSHPIAFRDIVQVKLLDRRSKRGLTDRLFGDSDFLTGTANTIGFCLVTYEREMRLLCKTLDDAKKWVAIFNAAQKLGSKGFSIGKSPSRTSMSTEPGSDEGPPQLSDTDSGHSGYKPAEGLNPDAAIKPRRADCAPKQDLPPWLAPTPEPGSKPEALFEPDNTDAFALLEALQEELGPMPSTPPGEASKVDAATAIKTAKAKREKKAKGSKLSKDGSALSGEQPAVRNLAKEMSAEDRNARDIALLQKVQMPHRSSKTTADDAPPLKATRPLKRHAAWDEGIETTDSTAKPNMGKVKTPTQQGWVSENAKPGEGKAAKDDDGSDWDGDAEEVQPAAAWVRKQPSAAWDNNSWDGSGDERVAQKAKSSKKSKESKEVIFEMSPIKDDDPWDSDDDRKKAAPPVPKAFCGVSEGKVDHSSWDDDAEEQPARTLKKRSKSSKKKQEVVDEDDPTAGLDDLLDGKEVSIPVHQYVDGFQCTQCDFKVIRFEGFEWNSKAEYLFFRNYYGKPHKLKSRLDAKADHSAYCCQCAFKSVPSEIGLRDVKDGTRWKVVRA